MNPAAKRRKWIPSPDPVRETKVSIDFGVWTAKERTGEAIERRAALMGRTPAGSVCGSEAHGRDGVPRQTKANNFFTEGRRWP